MVTSSRIIITSTDTCLRSLNNHMKIREVVNFGCSKEIVKDIFSSGHEHRTFLSQLQHDEQISGTL